MSTLSTIAENVTPVAVRQLAFTGAMPVPFALGGTTAQVVGATLRAAPRRH